MNIISLQQNPLKPQYQPHFQANPKIAQEKILKGISENLMSNALKNGDVLELSTIINDPKKNKVFFATLGSLMVAAATKITEMLTGGSKEDVSSSEDIIEGTKVKKGDEVQQKNEETFVDTKVADNEIIPVVSDKSSVINKEEPLKEEIVLIRLSRHQGMPNAKEKALEIGINDVSERLNLEVEDKNSLISLYNKFCGNNYKGISYNQSNAELSNSVISQELTGELGQCSDKKSLKEIINKYNLYSSEKFEQPIEEPVKEIPVEVPAVIATRNNIKNAYVSLDEDSRQSVNEFLDYVANQDSILPKKVLQKINKDYSDCLPEIATINSKLIQLVNAQNKENEFLSLLSNGLIAKDALKTYLYDDLAKSFSFIEYNSLVYNNCSTESIENLAKMRNKGDISSIIMNYADNSFELKFHSNYIDWSLRTILKTFKAIHGDSTRGLQCYEQIYKIEDIENEINNNKATYPLLYEYLNIKGKNVLNKGKEEQLLKIYYGAKVNQDFFTMHSYLRFVERYIMPKFKNELGTLSSTQIKYEYKSKFAILRNSILDTIKSSVKVYEYSVEEANIKAPKIKVPYGNAGEFFEITINDAGKVHTIF